MRQILNRISGVSNVCSLVPHRNPAWIMAIAACRKENQKRPGSKSHELYERYKRSRTLGEVLLWSDAIGCLEHADSQLLTVSGFALVGKQRMASN